LEEKMAVSSMWDAVAAHFFTPACMSRIVAISEAEVSPILDHSSMLELAEEPDKLPFQPALDLVPRLRERRDHTLSGADQRRRL
jgi:hypothetical protein